MPILIEGGMILAFDEQILEAEWAEQAGRIRRYPEVESSWNDRQFARPD